MGRLKKLYVRCTEAAASVLRKIGILERLLLAFLLLGVLPSVFLTAFTFQQYVAEIKANTTRFTSLLVQNVQLQAASTLRSYESAATRLYSDGDLLRLLADDRSDGNAIGVGRTLYAAARDDRDLLNIEIVTSTRQFTMVDRYGEKRGAYLRDLEGFQNSEYYQSALRQNGYPVWFDTSRDTDLFYRNESANFGLADYLTMCQAIYSGERTAQGDRVLVGVLVLNVRVDALVDPLRSYSFYGSGNTFLLSQKGVITGVNTSLEAPNLSDLGVSVAEVFSNAEGSYEGPGRDGPVFLSYKNIPYTDFYIAHIVGQDDLLRNAYQIRDLCVVVTLSLTLVCLLAAWLTTLSISRPLNRLNRAMKAFTKDGFDVKFAVTGHDEVSVLGENFNEMADNTKELIERVYLAELREKTLELSQKNAELNALQMQMNPHFLYNTLDIIRWEAMYEAGAGSKASQMIGIFCRLMRMGIKAGDDVVSVEAELEHARAYIDVVNFRDRPPIGLIWDMTFEPHRYGIPKFTLQPLMENTVLHAFPEGETASREWGVRIHGFLDRGDLILTVADNGAGMDEPTLCALRRSLSNGEIYKQSVGMRNVNQRIKLYYGEEYGVTLESKPDFGTTVVVRLPTVLLEVDPDISEGGEGLVSSADRG